MGRDFDAEFATEVIGKALDEVVRAVAGVVDGGVVTVYFADAGCCRIEGGDVGIVLPELGARGAYVGAEFSWGGAVEIAQGGGEHEGVAGGEGVFQDEISHGILWGRGRRVLLGEGWWRRGLLG